MKAIDFTGTRKGKLTALYKNKERPSHWICKCDCGIIKSVAFSGTSAKSCGCLHTPNDEIYHLQLKERIMKNINCDENNCWNWQLRIDDSGYGYATYRRSPMRTHRLSWIVFKGEIPKGKCVCHSCDNRKCCNPNHLFIGSNKENSEDMKEKGRQVKGSKSPFSKLNENQVLEIRKLYETGNFTQLFLGEKFGVRQTKISEIVNRKTWKHI